MIYLLAILIWLTFNYYTWWIQFNSLVCIFAWIFLIMPFLLKIKITELFKIDNFKYLFKNIFFNFWINIILALILAYLFFPSNDSFLYWLLLLSILSWWWLLLSWINRTKWDKKIGFQLFLVNFIIFNVIFLALTPIIDKNIWKLNNNTQQEQIFNWKQYWTTNENKIKRENNTCIISNISWWTFTCLNKNGMISPYFAFFILIIFPFLISRIVIYFKKFNRYINKHINQISRNSTFLLILYLFSLKDLHTLLEIDIFVLFKIWIVVLLYYFILFLYNYIILIKSKKTPMDISLYWLGTTRFITLWLIFSFVYSFYLWNEIILIFVFSYFYQIIFSIFSTKIINNLKH